ncbi:MAG: peptidylprolyl isomerase [Pseudomonadota bacterium]
MRKAITIIFYNSLFLNLILLVFVTCEGKLAKDAIATISSKEITSEYLMKNYSDLLLNEDKEDKNTNKLPNLNINQFEELLKFELLYKEALKSGIQNHDEVKRAIVHSYLRKHFSIEQGRDLESLKKYYEEHKNEYYTRSAQHILIGFEDSKHDISKEEKLKLAQSLLKRVLSGEDFAALAKEYSDDAGTAENRGDLGNFPENYMVKEFNDAVFNAKKTGIINKVIESSYGYHVIYYSGDAGAWDDVKNELFYLISRKEKSGAYTELLKKLKEGSKIEADYRFLENIDTE